MKKIFLVLLFVLSIISYSFEISIKNSDLKELAGKIYFNECGSNKENLIFWNKGEEFISIGIGHFIWYPKNFNGIFEESFPEFINFLKESEYEDKEFLNNLTYCPWENREKFFNNKKNKDYKELMNFLEKTVDYQMAFILENLKKTYENIQGDELCSEKIKNKFEIMAKINGGYYALIDYINFKGSGLLKGERYKGQGWGLVQVLENMNDVEEKELLKEFSRSAKEILRLRIENSPKERGEIRWLKGWENRVSTYIDTF